MVRHLALAVMILAAPAVAQISTEEAMARLRERQRLAATRPSPRREPIQVQKPAMHKEFQWRAKPNAPREVVDFVASLPERRQLYINSLKAEIATMKAHRSRTATFAPGWIQTGPNGEMESDEAAKAAQEHQILALSEEIERKWKEVKAAEADTLWLPRPGLQNLDVGAYGFIPTGSVEVEQVVGPRDLIGRVGSVGGKSFWFTEIDTKNVVDGEQYAFSDMVIVSGTKRYVTVMGGSRTVPLVKPLQLMSYLEKYEVDVPK